MVKYCADAPDALHETVTMPLACVATTFCGVPGFTVITRTAGGAGGAGGAAVVTVRTKVNVPLFSAGSEVVPLTLYVPALRAPAVVTTPPLVTLRLDDPPVFVYVTAPTLPVEVRLCEYSRELLSTTVSVGGVVMRLPATTSKVKVNDPVSAFWSTVVPLIV
jgi:hypothetical protein